MNNDSQPGDLELTEPRSFPGSREFPPPSATVRVTFGARSRCGSRHALNEDHYLVTELGRHQKTLLTSLPDDLIAERFDEYGYAMVVADGVGGEGGGEAASRLAIGTLHQLVIHFGKWNLRIDNEIAREVMDRAERFYRHVDATMVQESLTGAVSRLETTLTATFGSGRDLFFAHVGHSRAYLLRQGELMRLTRDHTVGQRPAATVGVAPLIDLNTSASDLKQILTQALGMPGTTGPSIDLERFQVDDGDRVLVCTNGLTDVVDEDIIAGVLASSHSPNDQCVMLVDLAMSARGEDDVTALVAHFQIPERAHTRR